MWERFYVNSKANFYCCLLQVGLITTPKSITLQILHSWRPSEIDVQGTGASQEQYWAPFWKIFVSNPVIFYDMSNKDVHTT